MISRSGRGKPAGDGSTLLSSPAGHISCWLCQTFIRPGQYATSTCWTDPGNVTVAAHDQCLRALGETELHLPPDPGEPDAAHRDPPAP